MTTVGVGAAFLAGIASFLSPCVLPLVPGYLSFISGMELEELAHGADRKAALRDAGLGSVFFVLGFSVVFTALGASASAVGALLGAHLGLMTKLAGAVIVIFGLHTAGILPIKWLYYEKRASTSRLKPGYASAFVMGLAFAFGWTPCIGPILGSILALAATQETVAQGMFLLFVYSMGLGIPFLLTGLALDRFLALFARYKRFLRWGEVFAGLALVAGGLLIFFNRLSWVIRLLPASLGRFTL